MLSTRHVAPLALGLTLVTGGCLGGLLPPAPQPTPVPVAPASTTPPAPVAGPVTTGNVTVNPVQNVDNKVTVIVPTPTPTGVPTDRPLSKSVDVTSITPASGFNDAATPVTISGAGFQSGITIMVGGKAATDVVVESPTQLKATIPAGLAEGKHSVSVSAGQGGTRVFPDAYSVQVRQVDPFAGFTFVAPLAGPVHQVTNKSVTISANGRFDFWAPDKLDTPRFVTPFEGNFDLSCKVEAEPYGMFMGAELVVLDRPNHRIALRHMYHYGIEPDNQGINPVQTAFVNSPLNSAANLRAVKANGAGIVYLRVKRSGQQYSTYFKNQASDGWVLVHAGEFPQLGSHVDAGFSIYMMRRDPNSNIIDASFSATFSDVAIHRD